MQLLADRLRLIFGAPAARVEIESNKRWFDLNVNDIVAVTTARAPDSAGAGWSGRLMRLLRNEVDPVAVSGRVLLMDLESNATANYGVWKATGANNWAAASAAEKTAGGFWCDDNDRPDPADATSEGASLWA